MQQKAFLSTIQTEVNIKLESQTTSILLIQKLLILLILCENKEWDAVIVIILCHFGTFKTIFVSKNLLKFKKNTKLSKFTILSLLENGLQLTKMQTLLFGIFKKKPQLNSLKAKCLPNTKVSMLWKNDKFLTSQK